VSKEKKFSRKHTTNEAHKEAHNAYLAEHGVEARERKADEREKIRDARSPKEQLAVLDKRLGSGKGARKERSRLQALIDKS